MVPLVGLCCMIVVISDPTHLLFVFSTGFVISVLCP